jgi:putative SOS response-associated peptidase YedK
MTLTTNDCRLENMTSKLYKPSLAKGRCVVVCEEFCEWEKSGGVKQPYLVYRPGGRCCTRLG